MAKENKKKSSLLGDMISDAKKSGSELDVHNAPEFLEGSKTGKLGKGSGELGKFYKAAAEKSLLKKSFDLSPDLIKNIRRFKHWEELKSESEVVEKIMGEYFKANPQKPLKNE